MSTMVHFQSHPITLIGPPLVLGENTVIAEQWLDKITHEPNYTQIIYEPGSNKP